jgi:hypothetical protein
MLNYLGAGTTSNKSILLPTHNTENQSLTVSNKRKLQAMDMKFLRTNGRKKGETRHF